MAGMPWSFSEFLLWPNGSQTQKLLGQQSSYFTGLGWVDGYNPLWASVETDWLSAEVQKVPSLDKQA